MSESSAVQVQNVSKKFSRSLKRAMVYGLQDVARAAFFPERFRSPNLDARIADAAAPDVPPESGAVRAAETDRFTSDRLRPGEFWALRDVSFSIRRGECLGIIGHNGAGKTTLFSILSGICGLTEGRVEIRGRLQSLLALGAGFHPMLSGRENIYLNASVLGLKDREIDRLYNDIVDFAELRDFIDMPVKNYSSGMHVRLGFSVAVHLDPDVLLVDEVLAVGDLSFQRKCIERIGQMLNSDMAVSLISHSLYQIESLSERALWLDAGRIRMIGDSREVVMAYRNAELLRNGVGADSDGQSRNRQSGLIVDSPLMSVTGVELLDDAGRVVEEVGYGQSFTVQISYVAKQRIARPLFNMRFSTGGAGVFETSMLIDGRAPECIDGPGRLSCRIRTPRLLPNVYDILLFIRNPEGAADLIEATMVKRFAVSAQGLLEKVPSRGPYAVGHLMHGMILFQDYEWDLEKAVGRDGGG